MVALSSSNKTTLDPKATINSSTTNASKASKNLSAQQKRQRDQELLQEELKSKFAPNLGLDFKVVKSLYDIKDRDKLFFTVQFVLEHMDKEKYKKFRSGQLSFSQCISRIEAESRNGVKYKVLDDLKAEFDADIEKKPTAATIAAYKEQVVEDRLMKDARKRGIDPEWLKKTAPNLNLQERCAQSIYARPRCKSGLDFEQKQNFKIKEVMKETNMRRKKELDEKIHDNLIKKINAKERRTMKVMKELA